MAAAFAAEEDRQLAADQFASTVGEDRWQADQECSVILPAGSESHLTRRLFTAMVRIIATLPVTKVLGAAR